MEESEWGLTAISTVCKHACTRFRAMLPPTSPPPNVALSRRSARPEGGRHELHNLRGPPLRVPRVPTPPSVPRRFRGGDGGARVAPRPVHPGDGGRGAGAAHVRAGARVRGGLDGGEPAGGHLERERGRSSATAAGVHLFLPYFSLFSVGRDGCVHTCADASALSLSVPIRLWAPHDAFYLTPFVSLALYLVRTFAIFRRFPLGTGVERRLKQPANGVLSLLPPPIHFLSHIRPSAARLVSGLWAATSRTLSSAAVCGSWTGAST